MLRPGVDYLLSPLLQAAGFRHAFFTRSGGVSTGPYATLSFSVASGDDEQNVKENLRRAEQALGVGLDQVHFLSQVHGTQVCEVKASERREDTLRRQGDAVLSAVPDLACAVRSADCVPLLFADCGNGLACAAHAGWRGVAAGMASAAVSALRARPGSGTILAAIGPHISLDAFEVGPEVADQLHQCCPEADAIVKDRWPKPHVDLARILRRQLADAGLGEQQIEQIGGCTVGDPARFFSFRRDGARSGRHLSAIKPRP